MKPLLSVVIPTHNRQPALVRLLRCLAAEDFPADKFEVIVIADGCPDDTVAALRAQQFPFSLRVLEQSPARGPGIARNVGAQHAIGAVLLFIDDDIEPFPGLLNAHADLHAHAAELVVIGAPVPVRIEPANFHRIAAWAWWEQQFERMSKPGYRFLYSDFLTGVLSISADLYKRVGGFDDYFAECHEDWELGLRLLRSGARVQFSRAAGGMHHEVRDLAPLLARKRAEGKADVRLAQRYPELWRVLRISDPEPPRWSTFGLVRRSAFSAPGLGKAALAVARRLLGVLERLNARRAWMLLHGAAVYFSYWRGAALEADGSKALSALARASESTAYSASVSEIDLADGISSAEGQLDAQRPDALRVLLNGLFVGELPAVPGAEPLRGAHLRRILATDLADEVRLLLALAPVHAR